MFKESQYINFHGWFRSWPSWCLISVQSMRSTRNRMGRGSESRSNSLIDHWSVQDFCVTLLTTSLLKGRASHDPTPKDEPSNRLSLNTASSILSWRILGTGEPDGLPSMGSHRVGHDWSDLAAAATQLGEGNDNHSSILARRIPWTEESGGLQSTWL